MHIQYDFQIIKNVIVTSVENNKKLIVYLYFKIFTFDNFYCYLCF